MLGDAHGVQLVAVLRKGFADTSGERGLAYAALLVADDDPLGVFWPDDAGGGVGVEPEQYGLRQSLDERDTAGGAVLAELVPVAWREEGGEGLRSSCVGGGEVRSEAAPRSDAGFDSMLDVGAVLCSTDLQVLLQGEGSLETTFSRSPASDEVMGIPY